MRLRRSFPGAVSISLAMQEEQEKQVQLPDPLTVPLTRRYPVLADIFNRLGYMERKSSGSGKIIGGSLGMIPQKKMAMTLGISSKTVKRHIKDIGIVRFIGRGSNGHWGK